MLILVWSLKVGINLGNQQPTTGTISNHSSTFSLIQSSKFGKNQDRFDSEGEFSKELLVSSSFIDNSFGDMVFFINSDGVIKLGN